MMAKKKSFEEIADGFSARDIEDLELLVLRAHTYVEAMLRRVLSDRLGVPETGAGIGGLNFFRLAQLTLGREADKELLGLVERLNRVRNEIAHELRLDPTSPDLEAFVCETIRRFRPDYRWPSSKEGRERREDFCHALVFVARKLIDMMTPRDLAPP